MEKESVTLEKEIMNQNCENNIVMKVKIQTRLSDLVPDVEFKTLKGEDGHTNGDLTACSFPSRELRSVPWIKVEETAIQDQDKEKSKNMYDSRSITKCNEDPMVKLKLNIKDPDQGSNLLPSLRRKSVASSTPTRSQTLADQKTTRPILRKCSSLRETRQARRRGVEESKIVR